MLLFCKTFSITFFFFKKPTGDALIFNYCDVLWVRSAVCDFLAQSSVSIVYIQGSAKYRTTLTNLIDIRLFLMFILTLHIHICRWYEEPLYD